MHAMGSSHQTCKLHVPASITMHQSFCIVRFLAEGPPKRLSPPWKNICVQAGNKVSVYMSPKTELYGLQDIM